MFIYYRIHSKMKYLKPFIWTKQIITISLSMTWSWMIKVNNTVDATAVLKVWLFQRVVVWQRLPSCRYDEYMLKVKPYFLSLPQKQNFKKMYLFELLRMDTLYLYLSNMLLKKYYILRLWLCLIGINKYANSKKIVLTRRIKQNNSDRCKGKTNAQYL